MHKAYVDTWPVLADAGKRVLAQTLDGEMVEGRIEHAGFIPGEDEQIPMFSLAAENGEFIDWGELGGWKFV